MNTLASLPLSSWETLRWRAPALEILDQRELPHTLQYIRCLNAIEVAEAIRHMAIRGAPAIGCAAAFGVALEAIRLQEQPNFFNLLELGFTHLAKSRPTAVNLFWALKQMRDCLDSHTLLPSFEITAALLKKAQDLLASDLRLNHCLGDHGATLLKTGARVLTHCNAGALATAGHGTALGVIRSAVNAGKKISVYADETRPWLQGARLTSWELQQSAIPVTLIVDSAAGYLMSLGQIDAVIVGADRISANADVANKIGTYTVAVLARRHGIPFYVAAPLSTIDLTIASGREIPIEQRNGEELTGYGGIRWAPEGINLLNPAFDVTPAELVSALITERGVIHSPNEKKLRAFVMKPD